MLEKIKNWIKDKYVKIANWLDTYEWVWGPAGFGFIYWFIGFFLGGILGLAVGVFDLSFVQPIFLAMAVFAGGGMAFAYCVRYIFNDTLYKYLYKGNGTSFDKDFKSLTPIQRVITQFLLFAFVVYIIVKVFITTL